MKISIAEYRALTGQTQKKRQRRGKPGGVSQLLVNEPGRIVLLLPILIEIEQNLREHWGKTARRAKLQREEVWAEWLAKVGKVEIGLPCTVKLTRYGVRRADDDGVVAGFKHVRDQVAAMIGCDDADPRIAWRYDQKISEVRLYKCEIEVTWNPLP